MFSNHRLLSLLQLILLILTVDLLCGGFAVLSIKAGNGFLFYYPSLYKNITDTFLASENAAPPTGWLKDDMGRQQPSLQKRECGVALGDSFTYAEDVEDADAWPHLLSVALGCSIDNLGVGGYGLDQAYLRYLPLTRKDHVVIIGLYHHMLRRNGAASYTFFAGQGTDHLPTIDMTKPVFRLGGERLELIPRPVAPISRESIAAHHKLDFYEKFWTPLRFPFSISVVSAVYKHFFWPRMTTDIFSGNPRFEPVMAVSYKILAAADAMTNGRGARLVIAMIPTPADAANGRASYENMIPALNRAAPNACVIDLHPALHDLSMKIGVDMIHSKRGHYNAPANKVIAETVAKGMFDCGIVP